MGQRRECSSYQKSLGQWMFMRGKSLFFNLVTNNSSLFFHKFSLTFSSHSISQMMHSLTLTAIIMGNKIKILERIWVMLKCGVLQETFQNFRASAFVLEKQKFKWIWESRWGKTKEALIIKIAHKTTNNTIFMLLLLVVNSNCYCGHLMMRKVSRKKKSSKNWSLPSLLW